MQQCMLRFTNSYTKLVWLCLACCVPLPGVLAQTAEKPDAVERLNQFNSAIQSLAARVSPSVVQILVTRFGPREEGGRASLVVGRQQAIGSGVIVDPDGYIMTNAHVVEGAQRLRVVLPVPPSRSPLEITPVGKRQVLDAKVVGIHKETDLALLKIDGHHLPTHPLGPSRPVEQ